MSSKLIRKIFFQINSGLKILVDNNKYTNKKNRFDIKKGDFYYLLI